MSVLIDDCPPLELRSREPAIAEALSSLEPNDQRRLRAVLAIRVSSVDTVLGPDTTEQLAAVARLAGQGQSMRAAEKFRTVLASLSGEQVTASGGLLRACLGLFQGDRLRAMTVLLDKRTAFATGVKPPSVGGTSADARPLEHGNGAKRSLDDRLSYTTEGFNEALEELATRHIFQWATFYRDTLAQYFDNVLLELKSGDRPRPWLNMVKAAMSQHSTTIFQRGYQYQLGHNGLAAEFAVGKSLVGIERFLDLPLEFYSACLTDAHKSGFAREVRLLCSAMLSGVLLGYATAHFNEPGSGILPRNPRFWAHVLPFLTAVDLHELLNHLSGPEMLDGVHDSVLPFVRALDDLLARDAASAPLPTLSQFVDGGRRLEISLELSSAEPGSRRLEVHCHITQLVNRFEVEQAAGRGVGIVLGSVAADLRGQLFAAHRLAEIVVPTDDNGDEELNNRLIALLLDLGDDSDPGSGTRTINYNLAKSFPLESPVMARYNHVYRRSVRRLMESFERRNGVRLWCSVRRSGKTTACASDLGSTSSQSVVISQTCDSTGQMPDGDVFYGRIQEALASGARLAPDFVVRSVAASLQAPTDSRVVLVLDEYETLFGDLRTAMEKDSTLRYAVVQPLLNQLVTFARDNLLIFMGQQPDAHWILTDQNQLSPVVTQDAFPLFSHDPESNSVGEFHELVQKVMTSHAEPDPAFVGELYAETGGHPFLTGKLLVSFWDWLIETKRPTSVLAPVHAELFQEFTRASLNHTSIAYNSHYEMFKRAAADHLSPMGRRQHPWLHSVYSALRGLVLESPDTFSMPLSDFLALAERDCIGMSPEDLLSTASRANFLTIDSEVVRPRIRILGRIAAAVRPLQGAG
jgi:hypothetical protein